MKRFSKNIYTSIFIGPAVLVLFVFSVIPILIALGISFTDMDLIGLADWSSIQFFRMVYFMPTITNIVAIAVIWGYLYNTDYGLFNYLLSLINVNEVPWLDDALMAKISLIILAVWKGIGINMIIYLAALQAIPR